ncbi:MAG TPA: hypothetical protein VKV17_11310 [Bryobacteraceae bacterium]|nr:hypothetical protein [Bryobacteraceae bacterium]
MPGLMQFPAPHPDAADCCPHAQEIANQREDIAELKGTQKEQGLFGDN